MRTQNSRRVIKAVCRMTRSNDCDLKYDNRISGLLDNRFSL